MKEELSIHVVPVRCCWRSVTPWGTKLAFWWAELDEEAEPLPDVHEVAEYYWMDHVEIRGAPEVLPSLPRFIEAWRDGEVDLPRIWEF
jgi:(d)CTP diphosphatase